MARTRSRGLAVAVVAALLVWCGVLTGQSQRPPATLADLPVRAWDTPPPLSCRGDVDPELKQRVGAAVEDIWVKGKSWDAVRVLESALQRDPYLQLAAMTLGTWYWALEPPKALTILSAAIEKCPDTALLFFTRSNVHTKLGDTQAALADLDRSRGLGMDNVSVHFNRGNALAKLRRFPDAIAAFETALERTPTHPGALRNVVIANVEAGNRTAALAAVDRILAAVPSGELREWAVDARRKLAGGGQ